MATGLKALSVITALLVGGCLVAVAYHSIPSVHAADTVRLASEHGAQARRVEQEVREDAHRQAVKNEIAEAGKDMEAAYTQANSARQREMTDEEQAALDRKVQAAEDRLVLAHRAVDPTYATLSSERVSSGTQAYADADRAVRAANAAVDVRIARGQRIMDRAGAGD
jgi:hypothetical protein